ncbi:MAG: hypothetical protein HYV90_00200 [Candidatus Woesebacteria bacterium]|nr:MAG: hypothetical protein HYV90_00200 [Candidatus Woesebacteria bacterium]
MATKKSKSFQKLSLTHLLSLSTILLLVITLIFVALFVVSNYSFNINEKARECECDQYNGCQTGYKCSNATCGTCVKTGGGGTATPPPGGGGTGGGGGLPCIRDGACYVPNRVCCGGHTLPDDVQRYRCKSGSVCSSGDK